MEGGFYYRNPHTRGGVFRGPVLEDGTPTIKVADLSGDMSGNCPVIRIINNVPDATALAAVSQNPNCYSLIEKFPGGFTPQFGGYIKDASIAGGVRGEHNSGWFYDLSASVGRSNAQFYIYNTINPQLLSQRNDIPVHYDAGPIRKPIGFLTWICPAPLTGQVFTNRSTWPLAWSIGTRPSKLKRASQPLVH